jgi:hypothetical protein
MKDGDLDCLMSFLLGLAFGAISSRRHFLIISSLLTPFNFYQLCRSQFHFLNFIKMAVILSVPSPSLVLFARMSSNIFSTGTAKLLFGS